MIKTLRFMVLSLLAMLTTATFAQKTVTIDFDNDYQTIFPTITGVSSGSGDNYVADGDFPGVTVSSLIEGSLMITVAPAEDAKTPSRIWSGSPRLRMYSGTFALASLALPITKIEFDAPSKFNMSAIEGTLSETVWTGSSQSPIFMVNGNTQIKKIVVTLGGEGTNPGGEEPGSDDGLLSKFKFTSGSFTESDNQLVFDFVGVGVYNEQNIDVTGNFVFDLEANQLCTKTTVNITFPSAVIAQLAYLDTQANKEDYDSVSLDGATLTAVVKEGFNGYSKTVIKSMLKIILDNEQGGIGLLESPMTPNQANVLAGTLDKDEVDENGASKQDFYIKGKIASISSEFGSQYGNASFTISIDGKDDFTFLVYRALYLENKKWVDGNTQIKVGDDVIICGKVTNYKGNTPETVQGKAYIYSLNGKTKEEGGNDNPDTEIKKLTVEAALDIINGLGDGKKTDEEYLIEGEVLSIDEISTQYGNATFDIWGPNTQNSATYVPTVKVYRAKGFDNQSITDENIIKVGDKVVVRGKLQKYVKNDVVTPEVTNCYLVSVTPGQSEEAGQVWDFTKWSAATVAALKADAAASKTEGWSDVEKKADAEAGADPTDLSKDNCFWFAGTANADGTLSANGVVIEELKGLKFGNAEYNAARSLAIAVNYKLANADESKAFGPYQGPAYLWLGGKGKLCFTIPSVAAGSTITIEAESHKITDARGIQLKQGDTQIGGDFKPTTFASNSWTIENAGDVDVYNTNGCHIYKIEVATGTGIKAVKTLKVDNGFIYNLAGQRVAKDYKGIVVKDGRKAVLK